jgi:hypothetical protein
LNNSKNINTTNILFCCFPATSLDIVVCQSCQTNGQCLVQRSSSARGCSTNPRISRISRCPQCLTVLYSCSVGQTLRMSTVNLQSVLAGAAKLRDSGDVIGSSADGTARQTGNNPTSSSPGSTSTDISQPLSNQRNTLSKLLCKFSGRLLLFHR